MIGKRRKSRLLVVSTLFLVLTGFVTQSEARVNVDIGINLPSVSFAAPPEVVVIPGTNVYAVPDSEVDIVFYQGYWWRHHEGGWYRSRDYNRGWSRVAPGRIPGSLRALPQDYRHHLEPGYERIPHGDVKKNWKKWEKEKHWEKQGNPERREQREQNREERRGEQNH